MVVRGPVIVVPNQIEIEVKSPGVVFRGQPRDLL